MRRTLVYYIRSLNLVKKMPLALQHVREGAGRESRYGCCGGTAFLGLCIIDIEIDVGGGFSNT